MLSSGFCRSLIDREQVSSRAQTLQKWKCKHTLHLYIQMLVCVSVCVYKDIPSPSIGNKQRSRRIMGKYSHSLLFLCESYTQYQYNINIVGCVSILQFILAPDVLVLSANKSQKKNLHKYLMFIIH